MVWFARGGRVFYWTSLLFVPEIWELVKKPTPLKGGGLVVNALIVAYLVHRLRRHED